jgi:dTMP kinase
VLRLVAIEGVDGSGKTTLSTTLTANLRHRGYTPIQLVEPSYSPLGRAVRERLSKPGSTTADKLHELFTSDRRHQVRTKLCPLLELSRSRQDLSLVIIQDRSYYSAAAYQRVDSPIEPTIAEQEAFAPRPELVILLDLPIETALARHRERGPRPEVPDPAALCRAREAYLRMAGRYGFDVRDATKPVETLTTTVADTYWPRIEAL